MNNTMRMTSFGGGVDSSALLAINLHRDESADLLGISREQLDKIYPPQDGAFFSDTGAERLATYANVLRFMHEYELAGIPFVIVQNPNETLPQWLNRLGCLPLMAGSSHLCSLKFKMEVIHPAAAAMFPQSKFVWAVGIEANEDRRCNKAFTVVKDNDTHTTAYPLRDLGLDRAGCIRILTALGYPAISKSACVFCPFAQIEEIKDIMDNEPQGWALAKKVEADFKAMSAVKHGAWLAAGSPLIKMVNKKTGKVRFRAPAGMWRLDSHAVGARLFAKEMLIDGKKRQLSVQEWEQYFAKN